MTIKSLKTAFKKANKRVDKAFARYEKSVSKLYVVDYAGRAKRLQDKVFRPDGTLRDFATNVDDVFYYKRGKVYYSYRTRYEDEHQTYNELRKLESEIDAAVDEREKLLWQLEDLGVEVYRDDELWQ